MKKILIIGNRECTLYNSDDYPKAVIIHGYHPMAPNDDRLWERMVSQSSAEICALLSYTVDDWNKDFSPWKAINPLSEEPFSGEASKTLEWIEEHCIPFIKDNYRDDVQIILAGYSLSGLFALWSMYKSNAFTGAICCSGSMWFEGFTEYTKEHSINPKSRVYLSLGGKEEKTENPVVAQIGELTRNMAAHLENTLGRNNVILKMNKGGHFADSSIRIAQGIEWMLKQ